MGFPVKDNLISYFSFCEKVFVFAGRDPLPPHTTIPADDIDFSQRLIIKCRPHSSVSPPNNDHKKQAVALIKHEEDLSMKTDHSDNVSSESRHMTESQ